MSLIPEECPVTSQPSSGFELVAICKRAPRTEHTIYILAAGTLDIPKYVNFKPAPLQKRFEAFKAAAPYSNYWIVRHHKHGNKWKMYMSNQNYENTVLWARQETRTYKYHGFTVELSKDSPDLTGETVSVMSPETALAKEIDSANAALSGGSNEKIMESLTSIKELEEQLRNTLEIVTAKREQLDKRFKGWFE